MKLCLGTDLAHARAAGPVTGQQANAALPARAWCSLDAGGELLAASFCGQTGDTGINPTSADKLLAATSAQPPPCAHFSRARTTIFATFQATSSLSKRVPWEFIILWRVVK